MANPIKWIFEAVGGNMAGDLVIKSVLGMWNLAGVKDGVSKAAVSAATSVIRDTFSHDWSDEQYYIKAAAKLDKAERVKLDKWLAAFKSDDQRNRFRKSTTQFKWEGHPGKEQSQVYDVDATVEVLKAIAQYDDAQWAMFMKNINLQKPMPAKRFIVMITKNKPALARWISQQKAAYVGWSTTQVIPAIDGFTARLAARRAARKPYSWEL
jgi:hypothetical protein